MAWKDKSKQRFGDENGRFEWGKSSDYRRRVAGAKKGEIVHHLDKNPKNNSASNFEIEKPKDWMTATWVHNRKHLEKARAWWRARAKMINKK